MLLALPSIVNNFSALTVFFSGPAYKGGAWEFWPRIFAWLQRKLVFDDQGGPQTIR